MNFRQVSPAFNDVKDSLALEYKDDASNSVVVFGAHLLSFDVFHELKSKHDKVIVFQLEQITTSRVKFLDNNYVDWMKSADEVWDFDKWNIDHLKTIRSDIKLHLLRPYKVWPESHSKDIDILFYGTPSRRRRRLLNHLKRKYNVCALEGEFDNLDDYILRSRVLLNIHYYPDSPLQEQARMIRWIGAPCQIISEKSANNYLGVKELEYKELFDFDFRCIKQGCSV